MSTAPADATTVRQFLELLASAELVSKDDLAAVKAQWSEAQMSADANELARGLVQLGKLTKYQAASVYQKRPKSLGIGGYVFLDRLGTGGSGSVFKAKHRKTGDIVAVKVLNLHGSRSADALKRFQREAETAARLQHPNLVRALETGESGGQYYTVMELVEGIDLSTYVKKQGPLPFEQAAHCILETARALAYAHEQGVVHRDIKPANLMLSAGGKIKVLDMGLARLQDPGAEGNEQAADGLTQTGQVMGTVDYMAPEQALHTRHADARADVYSLGCTFYRLATGDIPFDGDSMVAKILAHREKPIPSIRARYPKAPPAVDVVLQRMLAKKPEDRYQSMKEVADDLVRCLEGRQITPLKQPVLPVAAASGEAESRSNTFTLATATPVATHIPDGLPRAKTVRKKGVPVWAYAVCAVAVLAAVGGGVALKMKNDADLAAADPPIEDEAVIPPVVKPAVVAVVPAASPTPSATAIGTASRPTVGVALNTVTTGANSTNAVVSAPPPTEEHRLASWCFSRGFRVVIHDIATNNVREIAAAPDLPTGPITIMAVLTSGTAPVSADDFDRLKVATELSAVSFPRAMVNDGSLARITALPKLQTVNLNHTSVGNASLGVLKQLGSLKHLELAGTQVNEAALDDVAGLKNLVVLNLSELPITDAGLAKLAGLDQLKTLHLGRTQITDAALATLTRFSRLEKLTIRDTQISAAGRQTLSTVLPRCQLDPPPSNTLTLAPPGPRSTPPAVAIAAAGNPPPGATPSGTASPAMMKSPGSAPLPTQSANIIEQERAFTAWCVQQGLGVDVRDYTGDKSPQYIVRSLDQIPTGPFAAVRVYFYNSVPATAELLTKLSTGRFVRGISLFSTSAIEPGSMKCLAQFPTLQTLTVSRTAFNDADAQNLRSLSELRQLELGFTQVTDVGLDAVATLTRLENLNLAGLQITDAGVAKIARLPALRRLQLEGTRVSDTTMALLSDLPNLQTLIIRNTQVSQNARQMLAAKLPACNVDGPWYMIGPALPSRDSLGPLPGTPVVASVTPLGPSAMSITPGITPPGLDATSPAVTPAATSAKLKVPETAELEKALKLIREELFKDDYATAKKPEERVTLGRKLLGEASGLRDDPAGRFVILREACELGAEGGDINVAYSAASSAQFSYEIEALEWLAEACEKAQKKVQPRPVCKATAEGLVPKVNEAVRASQFAVAERLMNAALGAGRKAQDSALLKQLVDRDKAFDVEKRRFEEVTKARDTLASSPDDAPANTTLGKFYCFSEAKWEEGLKCLAKGNDAALKELAEKSLPIPTALDDLSALGDLWWAKGEKAPKAAQSNLLLGALYWYELAAPQASGLAKSRIDKRVADARTALGDLAPPSTPTSAVATGIFSPPVVAPGATTPLPPSVLSTPAAVGAFAAWVYGRNGYLHIRYSNGTRFAYKIEDLNTITPPFTIEGVNFYSTRNSMLSDADLQYLSSLSWLPELSLSGMTAVTDASLAKIASMPALQVLNISNCTQITESGFSALAKAARMTRLTLSSTRITDQGLAAVANLRNLQSLYLGSCKITDAGLVHLQNLTNLDYLNIDNNPSITDAGLSFLRNMRNLDTFYAVNTQLTGQGLAALIGSNDLDGLYLNDTKFNDAGADVVSRLTSLNFLYLQNTQLTDAGLMKLSTLPNLNSLDVSGTRITDASAQNLARMARLSTLYIRRSQLTPAAIQAIQTQKPQLRIYTN